MMWDGWGTGMMIMMFLLWTAIIVAIIFFMRWLLTSGYPGRRATSDHESDSALDILNKRYARGEMSKQEYEDMRRDMQ